jgi:hypothetical protein
MKSFVQNHSQLHPIQLHNQQSSSFQDVSWKETSKGLTKNSKVPFSICWTCWNQVDDHHVHILLWLLYEHILAKLCQVVWDANNIMVHVRRIVVSCPTKKVLQLSINGCMPKSTIPPWIVISYDIAMSMRPNKSLPYVKNFIIVTNLYLNYWR